MLEPATLAGLPLQPPTGVAIAEAIGAAPDGAGADWAAEQADLFAGSELLAEREGLVKRRGRPPGAQTRSTAEWRTFLLAHFRSPLIGLLEIAACDPVELAAMIRTADRTNGVDREVSVLDVLQLQRACRDSAAPYLHRRQPLAIDAGEGKPLPSITQVIVASAEIVAAQGFDGLAPMEVAAQKSPDGGDVG